MYQCPTDLDSSLSTGRYHWLHHLTHWSGSVDVSGGDTNNYTLTGLASQETYEIIVGTSEHFYSESVEWSTVTLVPSELNRYKTKGVHVHVN